MIRFSARPILKPLLAAAVVAMLPATAWAQAASPAPWSTDTAYGYDSHFHTKQYKLGTSNAGLLLKGAKKVPKNTLFFIGANGQLYMRTGPFLNSDGTFMFGPS